MHAFRDDELRGVRWNVYLGIAKFLFVLGFVIPGLMYIRHGHRTWRKDGVAIEFMSLIDPIFITLTFMFLGILMFDISQGTDLNDPSWDDNPLRRLLFLGFLLGFHVLISSLRVPGSILILRGRKQVVLDTIKLILAHHRLGYTLDVDEFDIPSIKMRIEVDDHPTRGQVSIIHKTRNKEWRETIHEGILNVFEGTPSEGSHPSLLILGGVLVGIGIALGVAFIIG